MFQDFYSIYLMAESYECYGVINKKIGILDMPIKSFNKVPWDIWLMV